MGVGLEVAVVGLAVVFTFLTALVLSVHALGWFFRHWGGRLPDSGARPPGGPGGPAGSGTARIAAVVAAVELHRSRGGR